MAFGIVHSKNELKLEIAPRLLQVVQLKKPNPHNSQDYCANPISLGQEDEV